jgi:hypothetical protein
MAQRARTCAAAGAALLFAGKLASTTEIARYTAELEGGVSAGVAASAPEKPSLALELSPASRDRMAHEIASSAQEIARSPTFPTRMSSLGAVPPAPVTLEP